MDKLLAKYADYSPIDQAEQVADLNRSDDAGPSGSRSTDDTTTIAGLSSTSTVIASARHITPSSSHHHDVHHQVFSHLHDHSPFPGAQALIQRDVIFRQYVPNVDVDVGQREWTQYANKGDPHQSSTMLPEIAGLSTSDNVVTYVNRATSSSQQEPAVNPGGGGASQSQWVASLLVECARAVAVGDSERVKNLMWALNELGSPYGDADQRIAAYFLQALFCRITGTGSRCHRILTTAAERTFSFDTVRKMILDYQEATPWTTFGHVAGNSAMMEAFEGEMKIHIVDISNSYCTQWPTLMEALATRADGTPHLRLSTVVISPEETVLSVMKQIMTRLERFARLMGVPFEYTVTHLPNGLEKLDFATDLELRQDEILAITCNNTLHHVAEITAPGTPDQYTSPRDTLLCTFRNANPKILVLVEDEMDLASPDFMTSFCEALRFYSLLFESIEENFPRTSNERLMLERICARNLVNLVACDPPENIERQEKGVQWDYRLRRVGLLSSPFSDDVVDDVRALLKRYKEGWGLSANDNRLYLTWKEQAVLCATAWKPIVNPSPE